MTTPCEMRLSDYAELLNPKDASEVLGLQEWTVRRMLRNGELPAVKIGARWYMPKSKLIEYLEG